MFSNPETDEICAMLRAVKTIAVVGLSPKPERASHRVARVLQGYGYRVIPVRPALSDVLGEKAYARLSDVPAAVDLVDVFRAGKHVDAIVDECIRLGVPRLWLQDGVINEPAALRARAAGIDVVMDRCIGRDRAGLCA